MYQMFGIWNYDWNNEIVIKSHWKSHWNYESDVLALFLKFSLKQVVSWFNMGIGNVFILFKHIYCQVTSGKA